MLQNQGVTYVDKFVSTELFTYDFQEMPRQREHKRLPIMVIHDQLVIYNHCSGGRMAPGCIILQR